MKTIFYPEKIGNLGKLIITIGNFDGVHIGHQDLISKIIDRAKLGSGKSAVVTFNPHPSLYFNKPEFFEITNFEQKQSKIASLGVDYLIVLDFPAVASLSGQDFVSKILVDYIHCNEIWVGEDFHFGKGRQNDIQDLKNFGLDKFVVNTVAKLKVDGQVVSSSLIRRLIKNVNSDQI